MPAWGGKNTQSRMIFSESLCTHFMKYIMIVTMGLANKQNILVHLVFFVLVLLRYNARQISSCVPMMGSVHYL